MFEQQYVLSKIEQWAERLPYNTLRIEVELPGQTPHAGEVQSPAHWIYPPPPTGKPEKEVMHGGGA